MKKNNILIIIFTALAFLIAGCDNTAGGGFIGSHNKTILKSYKKEFSYDSTNRLTKENLGDGNYIEYTYDDSGNLISQKIVK